MLPAKRDHLGSQGHNTRYINIYVCVLHIYIYNNNRYVLSRQCEPFAFLVFPSLLWKSRKSTFAGLKVNGPYESPVVTSRFWAGCLGLKLPSSLGFKLPELGLEPNMLVSWHSQRNQNQNLGFLKLGPPIEPVYPFFEGEGSPTKID